MVQKTYKDISSPQFEEVPEDRHVDRESPEVVGEVALREDALYHEDHHLSKRHIFVLGLV